MYCKYCGKPLDKDAQFCTHCGKALTDNTQQPTAEPIQKTARTKNLSRRNIIFGIIAGLILTAVCSPLVFIGRSQVQDSLLNPENRSGAVHNTLENLPATNPSSSAENSQETTPATDPAPTAASPALNYPDSPMVFASDQDDPNFEQCHADDTCWLQVFYNPAPLTDPPINLTQPLGFASASEPALSPDGTRVAFSGYVEGSDGNHIYLVNIDGSYEKVLTLEGYTHGHPSWSPDGSQLVVMSRRLDSTYFNLYLIDVESRETRQLTSGDNIDRFPDWSPDGMYIAFHSNRVDPDPANCWPYCQTGLYIVNVESGMGGPLKFNDKVINGAGIAWSPDGSQLAFHADWNGNWDIYIIEQDGSVRQLSDDPGDENFPSWSPDGQFIAYNSETTTGFDIAVTPADHFEPIYYTSEAGRDVQADW